MKVCHITSVHPNRDVRILYKECASLAKNGYDVYLVAQGESFEENDVKVIGFRPPGSRFERFLRTTKIAYKTATTIDADIYHLHDPELLLYANKLKKLNKIVIFDSHEDVPKQIMAKTWLPAFLRPCISFVYKHYENKKVKNLDAVITVIESIGDRIQKYNKNIVLVKNYPIIGDIVCNNDNFSGRDRIICYAGYLSELRGIRNAVKAMVKINGRLILAGKMSETFKNTLTILPGWSQVKAVGVLDRKGLNTLYNKSMVGLCTLLNAPNHYNSLATKMFEYMSAEIPVVCSDFPLWKEVIEKNNCGICVDPNNIDAIVNAINYLLNNPDIARQMGRKGRQAVLEKYNWDVEEKKLVDLYKSLTQ